MIFPLDWTFLLLTQVTIVAALSLVIAKAFFRRNPAARHVVLTCALVAIAFSPVLIKASQFSPVRVISVPRIAPLIDYSSHAGVVAHAISPAANISAGHRRAWLDWGSAATLVWLLGVCVLLLRQGVCSIRIHRVARRAAPSAMLREPRVRVTEAIAGPMSVGLFRPVILLPADLIRSLSRRQLQQVIAHEQAHARRGDHFVSLIQQLVGIALWPHPFIRFLNRSLDQAREELCDNAVLSCFAAADYARTLLQIDQWMSDRKFKPANYPAALALLGRRWKLGNRIKDLLDQRRNLMTRAGLSVVFISITVLISAAMIVSCARVSKAGNADVSGASPASASASTQPGDLRPIAFTVGDRDFFNGDDIQIKQVRCTAGAFTQGEIIEVTGTYDLHSAAQANLHLYLTASASEPHAPELVDQGITARRGHGEFRLRETLSCQGWPHVTFYSNKSGKAFGGVYFGTGDWLLAKRGWESSEKNAGEVAREE